MRYGFGSWLVLFLALRASTVFAEPVISPTPDLPEITRGQDVTVHGKAFPKPDNTIGYEVLLSNGKPKEGIRLPAKWVDANSFTFALPPDKVPTGRYVVSVRIGDKDLPVPGDLRVLADVSAPVHLDGVYPITAYPTERSGCDFDIAGQNLAANPQDNMILVVGRGPVSLGDETECAESRKTGHYDKTCLYVDPGMETMKVHVVNFPRAKYDGPVKIQVQVGKNISNALPLVISRVSECYALTFAVVTFGVIMFVVGFLVKKGVGDHMISGKRYRPWTSFFLDKETNTYSLSKFQLFIWTSVFVFGYVYLFFCRMLIQWKFGLPPVPDGLPGMFAISAAAAVAAAGATETRGSKGSGSVHPSAADFVSTGGLVVGERFQFFVWTLVGAFGFVSALILADPSSLTELPKIPDNFLYLMGISSVGYLAGKVIRKPGPVIRSLAILPASPPDTQPSGQMRIRLQGENLADNAIVKVDDNEIVKVDKTTSPTTKGFSIVSSRPQEQPVDPAFCSELLLDLSDATSYMKGEHTLTLINRDGQSSTVCFRNDQPTIGSVEPITHGSTTVSIKVTGKNFDDRMTAEWKDAAGKTTLIKADNLTMKSGTELSITLVPGETIGTGTLTLISRLGWKVSTQITIILS